MSGIAKDYTELQNELEISDTAAAILILAEAIRESGTFRANNAENFGHELAMALKHVLEKSVVRIQREGE